MSGLNREVPTVSGHSEESGSLMAYANAARRVIVRLTYLDLRGALDGLFKRLRHLCE